MNSSMSYWKTTRLKPSWAKDGLLKQLANSSGAGPARTEYHHLEQEHQVNPAQAEKPFRNSRNGYSAKTVKET